MRLTEKLLHLSKESGFFTTLFGYCSSLANFTYLIDNEEITDYRKKHYKRVSTSSATSARMVEMVETYWNF